MNKAKELLLELQNNLQKMKHDRKICFSPLRSVLICHHLQEPLETVSSSNPPFAGTVITGYAIKKVIKLAAVIIGLFIAVLAYLEYHRILD
ncbi:MAG: FUN14 domain-containing protein [Candidatus Nitrosopolaris sp.]